MTRPSPIHDEATTDGAHASESSGIDSGIDSSGPATERPASMHDGGAPHTPASAHDGGAPHTPASAIAGVEPAPVPQRAAKSSAAAPRATPKRVETIPALRVAVLATTTPGEVRLIALGISDEAPPGAALAVLVPLSVAAGESVARRFGGHE